mmetsp:Transcript_125107/g.359203  ORF Transcript_125107/g.359203 Transcript_125107/m.359203 type:complete len:334 (+) Transcript_125107:1517-2518(+)
MCGHLAIRALLAAVGGRAHPGLPAADEARDTVVALRVQRKAPPLLLAARPLRRGLRGGNLVEVGTGVAGAAVEVRVETVNVLQVDVLASGEGQVQLGPPLVQEGLGDDAEPRRPQRHLGLQFPVRARQRPFERLHVDPPGGADLLGMRFQGELLPGPQLVQQQVVDLVLAPRGLAAVGPHIGGPIVHPSHVLEPLRVQLAQRDAELVAHLADRGVFHAHVDACGDVRGGVQLARAHAVERVAATSVCPHLGKRDLLRRALLQQELAVRVEQHHGKGPVQDAAGLPGHELVAVVLVIMADDFVHVVHRDALVLQHEVVLRHALRGPRGGLRGGH